MKRYQLIDHTADIGIIVYGNDLPEVFSNAAYSMFDILTDAEKIQYKEKLELQVTANSVEELLITWLDELLFRYETERLICNQFSITKMNDNSLTAIAFGEKVDRSRHDIKTEIKNVTYHQMRVEKTDSGWEAQIIFDV